MCHIYLIVILSHIQFYFDVAIIRAKCRLVYGVTETSHFSTPKSQLSMFNLLRYVHANGISEYYTRIIYSGIKIPIYFYTAVCFFWNRMIRTWEYGEESIRLRGDAAEVNTRWGRLAGISRETKMYFTFMMSATLRWVNVMLTWTRRCSKIPIFGCRFYYNESIYFMRMFSISFSRFSICFLFTLQYISRFRERE